MYTRNNSLIITTQREFRQQFPGRNHPLPPTIRRLVARFEKAGTTFGNLRIGRQWTTRPLENIGRVAESVQEDPETSIQKKVQQLGLSRSSYHRIL